MEKRLREIKLLVGQTVQLWGILTDCCRSMTFDKFIGENIEKIRTLKNMLANLFLWKKGGVKSNYWLVRLSNSGESVQIVVGL